MTRDLRAVDRSVIALGIFGAILVLAATRWGIGLGTDSLSFIEAARNMAKGQGLATQTEAGVMEPMTHWPPLYPFLIALPGMIGIDPLVAARWINAAFFAINIILVGAIVRRLTPGAPWVAVAAVLFVLFSSHLMSLHALAMTEPPYIAAGLAGLYLTALHCARPGMGPLIAGSVLVALALLTRYVAVAIVVSGVAALLLLPRVPLGTRLRDAAIFLSLSCGPLLAWLIRNRLASGASHDMATGFHPPTGQHFVRGLETLAEWVAPAQLPFAARLGVGVITLVAIYAVSRWAWGSDEGERANAGSDVAANMRRILVLFFAAHTLLLAAFITIFSLKIGFDPRYMSMAYIAGLILASSFGAELISKLAGNPRNLRLVGSVCGLLLAFYVLRGAYFVSVAYRDGIGYSSRKWAQSELLATVKSLPKDARIYTNARRVVNFMTGRSVRGVPWKTDMDTGKPNPAFESDVREMIPESAAERRVLAIFTEHASEHSSEEEVRAMLPLKHTEAVSDGAVFDILPHTASSRARLPRSSGQLLTTN